MDIAKYLADKQRYAGEKIPSMTRRRLGHDYEARRMYLITLTLWEHHNERRTIRRDQCLTLNDMVAMLCRGG